MLYLTQYSNNMTIDFLNSSSFKALSQVPGGRQIFKQFFNLFINYDRLWLYVYHHRTYNPTLTKLFQAIR